MPPPARLGCQRGLWFDNHGQTSPGFPFALFILTSERHRILPATDVDINLSRSEMEFSMKISARNQLKGTIVDVVKGATTSHIRIDIGGGVIVTSSITNEAVDELKLAKGKAAIAVIKASDVMVGVD
jgi:molybdopterin-binding protein